MREANWNKSVALERASSATAISSRAVSAGRSKRRASASSMWVRSSGANSSSACASSSRSAQAATRKRLASDSSSGLDCGRLEWRAKNDRIDSSISGLRSHAPWSKAIRSSSPAVWPIPGALEAELLAEREPALPRNAPPPQVLERLGDRRVAPECREPAKEQRFLHPLAERSGEAIRPADLDLPRERVGRDRFQMLPARQHGRGGLGPPARKAGVAVRRVPDQGEPVGNRGRRDPELRAHGVLVVGDHAAAVALDHPLPGDALGEILVRRADHDLVDGVAEPRHRGGQRVVRLELDHRPDHDADRLERALGQWKLGEQVLRNALLGLVAWPEVVAEAADHVVGGHGEVGDVGLAQERERRSDQAPDGSDFTPVGAARWIHAVVGPEELVSAVEEMKLHGVTGLRIGTAYSESCRPTEHTPIVLPRSSGVDPRWEDDSPPPLPSAPAPPSLGHTPFPLPRGTHARSNSTFDAENPMRLPILPH